MAVSKKAEFAVEYAAQVKALLDTLDKLGALKAEFLALEYVTTMTDTDTEPCGFLVADLYAAAGAVDALKTLIATGTNAKLLYTVGA